LSTRDGEQKPFLVICEREGEQTDYVARNILEHYERGIPLRRQPVLFRVGDWSDRLEVDTVPRGDNEIGEHGYPYH
jgi:superfamily I DNA/RNA helicase